MVDAEHQDELCVNVKYDGDVKYFQVSAFTLDRNWIKSSRLR